MSNSCDENEIKVELTVVPDVDPLLESYESDTLEAYMNDQDYTNNTAENNVNSEYLTEETWYKSINGNGRFICKYCDCTYATIQTLRHHNKTKHLKEYNRIKSVISNSFRRRKPKCHICKRRFKTVHELEDHIQKAHNIESMKSSCSICQATFTTDLEKLEHMLSNHQTLNRTHHICQICAYSTTKLSHFNQHQDTHSLVNLKKCPHCEYSTNYLPNLRIHERIHNNDKPYSCPVKGCEFTGVSKTALLSHSLKHERKFMFCDKCSYMTVYKQCLTKHMERHKRNSVRKKKINVSSRVSAS